jgi:hypothetical protein
MLNVPFLSVLGNGSVKISGEKNECCNKKTAGLIFFSIPVSTDFKSKDVTTLFPFKFHSFQETLFYNVIKPTN